MSPPVERLHAHLRECAREGAALVAVPPFTLYLPADPERAVAIPEQAATDWAVGLAALRTACARHGCRPRVEFLAEAFAGLPAALVAAGFSEEERLTLFALAPGDFRPAAQVPGLTILEVRADSPLADIRENLCVNERGFDPVAPPPDAAAAEAFRPTLVAGRAFTARLDGRAVAAGMIVAPRAGAAELAGITTLAPFRRRGIGAALTAQMARAAFGMGADLPWLSTGDPGARRVYARLGFQPVATRMAFGLRSPGAA